MLILDRLLAERDEKYAAVEAATLAIRHHGASAEGYILEKLKQPGRKRSLRKLRLALAEVRKRQTGAVSE